jgi:ADP-ribosylglycohydrolase
MMKKPTAMVWASLCADALALGAHWIYDVKTIDKKFGRVNDFLAPSPPTYHPTKQRGDLTHYGDQTLLLLQTISERGGFEADEFSRRWRDFCAGTSGYVDGATRQTLKNLAAGRPAAEAGSASTDLAGAARIAPLVFRYRNDIEALGRSAVQQTRLTHNTAEVAASAAFFARVAAAALAGSAPVDAMRRAAAEGFAPGSLAGWLSDGLRSVAKDTRAAVFGFGQMCEVEAAFPATVHLIAKYEDRLEEALIENVMAGGDSAGRGLIVGMVLGAYAGGTAIPERWLKALTAGPQIERWLAEIHCAAGTPEGAA